MAQPSSSSDAPEQADAPIHDPPPPIFITIGPPCCGKTTWIRNQTSQQATYKEEQRTFDEIVDVALDDQPGVYVHLPLEEFISCYRNQTNHTTKESAWTVARGSNRNRTLGRSMLQTRIYGKPLSYYIQTTAENHEKAAVVEYLLTSNLPLAPNQSTRPRPLDHDPTVALQRLEQSLRRCLFPNATNTSTDIPQPKNAQALEHVVLPLFLQTIQTVVAGTTSKPTVDVPPLYTLPPKIDMFVQQRLFWNHLPQFEVSAIDSAMAQLKYYAYNYTQQHPVNRRNTNAQVPQHPKRLAVAWGNTNTRPNDYKVALELAVKSKRPVYFVVYGPWRRRSLTTTNSPQPNEIQKVVTKVTPESYELEELVNPTDILDLSRESSDGSNLEVPNRRRPDHHLTPLELEQRHLQLVEETLEDDILELSARPFDQRIPEVGNDAYAGLAELLRRNLVRFLITGRYIPMGVLYDMHLRSLDSIVRCIHAWKKQEKIYETMIEDTGSAASRKISKFELDCLLARMANFEMHPNRTVTPLPLSRMKAKPSVQDNNHSRGGRQQPNWKQRQERKSRPRTRRPDDS